ncbi:hypothetical protein HMPREF9096_00267 [Haemophilus sp. oral taxon 851 str. F0397]|nr:hypothetical protein HMPREF9096_00267 [Haemophilus sp. oral taxon 851 str. F0397]
MRFPVFFRQKNPQLIKCGFKIGYLHLTVFYPQLSRTQNVRAAG